MICADCRHYVTLQAEKALSGDVEMVWTDFEGSWVCEKTGDEHAARVPFWIWIPRDDAQDVLVGPYLTEKAANLAAEEALLVEGILQDGGTDCVVTIMAVVSDFDTYIIDPDDPHHTGEETS